jgi:putative effector of murein hydrolase LrgA (UPF0299 family)
VVDFKKGLWVTATIAALIVGWLLIVPPAIFFISFFIDFHLADRYYSILYTAGVGLCFGSIIGFVQLFIIRRFYTNALAWVAANAFSWMMSFLIVQFSLASLDHSGHLAYNVMLIIMACLTSGFIQGLFTGIALHFLMSVQDKKSPETK